MTPSRKPPKDQTPANANAPDLKFISKHLRQALEALAIVLQELEETQDKDPE